MTNTPRPEKICPDAATVLWPGAMRERVAMLAAKRFTASGTLRLKCNGLARVPWIRNRLGSSDRQVSSACFSFHLLQPFGIHLFKVGVGVLIPWPIANVV